jgi:hypothetical protein
MLKVTGFTAALLFCTVQAGANPPEPASLPPAPDKSVKGLSEAVYLQLYKSFGGAGSAEDAKARAEALQTAIRADNVVDAAEADLLSEMIQPNVASISVAPPSARYQPYIVLSATGVAAKVLRQTLRPLTALRKARDGGKDGWALLFATYRRDAQGEADALEVLGERLTELAEQSNQANRFQPFRTGITGYYVFTTATDGGRKFLHRAAAQADKEVADKLPEFLYNWIDRPVAP